MVRLVRLVRPITTAMLVSVLVMSCALASPSVDPKATSPTTTPAASSTSTATSSAEPAPTPSSAPEVSPNSTASPVPSADVSSVEAILTYPGNIFPAECSELSATTGSVRGYHVAAVCAGEIRYMTSRDGARWAIDSIPPPADRLELYPQLAVDGDTIYLAYTRIVRGEGGCGDDGLQDLGVYVRSRHLPDGTWTEPVRVGSEGDGVQAFRVDGGVLHLTVTTADGGVVYESKSGSTLTRIGIPDAITTSLRIGDDQRARIAYATGHAIRYARVDGNQLSIVTVAATDETYLLRPALVLGPGDHGYLIWTQKVDPGGGCAEGGPGPLDGTYVGTDATGQWVRDRLTEFPNGASLTLDPSSGRLHVIAGDRLTYFTSPGDGSWTSAELRGTEGLHEAVIRLDPATGRPIVFALAWGDDPGTYVFRIP